MEQLMNFDVLNTVAEIELVYKSKVKPSERPRITSTKEAYQLLLQTWDANKIEFVEQFKVVLMNRAHRVLGIYELSSGGTAGTVADPKLVFMAALKSNACCLILSHNHPSGNLKPSHADEQLTQKIKQAGQLLDIWLIDHIIVTREGYYSFSDEQML
jgi:DNA repair protein RadC